MGIDALDLVFRLEKRLGVTISQPEAYATIFDTVGTIHRYLVAKLNGDCRDVARIEPLLIEVADAVNRIAGRWRLTSSIYGTEKALGYLIGEKFLNFLEVAERDAEWRAEIPQFVARIKESFHPWQLAEFFDTPRRLGALGHVADDEGHELFRSQVDESVNLREDARNLLLFEQARDWLLEDGTDNTEMQS